MTTITFIENFKGKPAELVVVANGVGSVTQVAVDNMGPGVDATRGGCHSRHALRPNDWLSQPSPPSEDELSLLKGGDNYLLNNRLLCQIAISEKISGMAAAIPAGST